MLFVTRYGSEAAKYDKSEYHNFFFFHSFVSPIPSSSIFNAMIDFIDFLFLD